MDIDTHSTCKESDLCKDLIKTYNSSIIEHFSSELKESCEQEANRCANDENMDDGRKRTVLAQIINNKKLNIDRLPKYDFIGGPMSLTYHMSKRFKKLI